VDGDLGAFRMGTVTRHLRYAVIMATLASSSLNSACGDGTLDVFGPTSNDGGTGASMSGAAGTGPSSPGGALNLGGKLNSGGSAGSSGGTEGIPPESPNPLAVDDFEDGNTQALCGDGHWYVSNDGTGTQSFGLESATNRPPDTHAMRTRGLDFTEWGAALGVDLEGSTPALDLTAYDELRLAIRAESGFEGPLDVSLLDVDDSHFLQRIELTSEWQELRLPLSSFLGPGGAALDRSRVGDLQFFVAPSQPFDFWIDDVAFFRAE
jgi:hypothetical protein